MESRLNIDGILVGNDNSYIVAEIGHNHGGDLERCKELFKSAKECGADAVKLQKRDNKTLYTKALYNSPYQNENSYGACLDESTQLLTKRGWLSFTDLKEDDKIATLSKSGEIKWYSTTNRVHYYYSGKMYHVQSRLIDLLVTPEHELYLGNSWKIKDKGYDFRKIKASESAKNWNGQGKYNWERWRAKKNALPKKGLIIKEYNIPSLEKRLNKPVKHLGTIPIKSLLRFMGYYISEGWVTDKGDGFIKLCQKTHPKVTEDMAKTIRELGLTPTISKTGVAINSRELAEIALECGRLSHNKRIPRWVFKLDSSLLWELFDSYMLGDGSSYPTTGKHRSWKANTVSKQLADDIQELALYLGYSSSITRDSNIYRASINRFKNEPRLSQPIKEESYNGYVWDITVPNHVFYVRRNGRTCWTGNSYGLHREALEFDFEQYRCLQDYCRELKITFFATAFDFPSVDFLERLNVPCYKIASGDLLNTPLQKYIAQTGKPIFLSTGGGTYDDIQRAYDTILPINSQLCIMQCTAAYPTEAPDMHLGVIPEFIKRYPKAVIGLSDHFSGKLMSPIAYILGARVFEKHFTLRHTWKGTDQAFSLEPEGLKKMILDLAKVKVCMSNIKELLECEKKPLYKMGKKLAFSRDVSVGEILTASDVKIISPNDGIPPYEIDKILGHVLKCNRIEDDTIHWEYVE